MEQHEWPEERATAASIPAANKPPAGAGGPLSATETASTISVMFGASWAEAPALRPFNFFDVLRHHQLSQGATRSGINDVYVLVQVDMHYRCRASMLQQQREHSIPFSLVQSLDGGRPPEERRRRQQEAEEIAAAARAAAEANPGCLYRLEDLYVCEPCGKVLSPFQVREEVECHMCPGCLDVLPPAEAAACGLRCSKCFSCPRCMHGLSLSRKKRDEAAANLPRSPRAGPSDGPLWGPEGVFPFVGEEEQAEDLTAVADRYAEAATVAEEAAAAAAAAGYKPLLEIQGSTEAVVAEAAADGGTAILAACEGDAALVAKNLEESGGFAAHGAPQRCDSLLSVRSLDGEAEEEGEESGAVGGEGSVAAYCSRQHLYFYACAHCNWSSEPAGISSPFPAALPLIATREERESLPSIIFGDLLQVLQYNAYERERTRQLQEKVKSRAVAALIAAASNPETREQRRAAAAAPTTWRLTDAQGAEAAKEKRIRELDIWTYRRPRQWTFAPPRVSLAAIAQGQHLRCTVKETLAAAASSIEEAEEETAAATAGGDAESVSSDTSNSVVIRRFPAFSEPLHAEQLQVDKGHPDVAPVCTTPHVVAAARGLDVRDRPGLEQLLQCPEAFAAAASGMRFLPLKRRCLLPRRSRRCCFCGRFVVKAQLSPNAFPPFKINNAAALYLPSVECSVGGIVGCLLQGQRGRVLLTLCSYADTPVTVTLMSATREHRLRRKRQQQQQPHMQELQELQGEQAEETDWWNVEWEGSLTVELAPYDELLDEIGAPAKGDPGALKDTKGTEEGDAVLHQWSNGALLQLEVYVHSNTNDSAAVLPFAAEVSLGGGGAPPSFTVHYVAFLGTVGRRIGGVEVKRTESI